MAENVSEQLLGYLLGALEDDEQQNLREQLSRDENLRRELALLRELIRPLERTRQGDAPPPQLAQRTCRFVAARAEELKSPRNERPVPAGSLHDLGEDLSLGGDPSRFSWFDLAAAAGILVAASLLLFPALQVGRNEARINACAHNLALLRQSLAQYGDAFAGFMPSAPPDSRLSVAGGFASILRTNGYLSDLHVLLCPSSPAAARPGFDVPTVDYIQAMPEGRELQELLASLGGGYSMSYGYMENGRFHALRSEGGSHFALVSDSPSPDPPHFRTFSHGSGVNVLYQSGAVCFVTRPCASPESDHIFLNAAGEIGLGLNRYDAVIPPAGATPIIPVGLRW